MEGYSDSAVHVKTASIRNPYGLLFALSSQASGAQNIAVCAPDAAGERPVDAACHFTRRAAVY